MTQKKVKGVERQRQRVWPAYASSYQDDKDFTGQKTDIKTLAFYLPQFHVIPENERWWGKRFTEWTNTRKGKPLYKDHYQPREPHPDIGYYDLSDLETLKKQAALARRHGVYGFCIYHYWFNGYRLLEKPAETLLAHPEIDINYCLCWANENWTKTWDGAHQDILVAQRYSTEDDIAFISSLEPYLRDPRYIRSNGKPVVMIYRPHLLPNPHVTFMRWRKVCLENGVGEIAIWAQRGCFYKKQPLGLSECVDAEVEFPPHDGSRQDENLKVQLKLGDTSQQIFNYNETAWNQCRPGHFPDDAATPMRRTVMLGWDNAARKKERAGIFHGFSLKIFQAWLRYVIDYTRRNFEKDDRFLFVNAWNEWGEGTYLEPDAKHGYASVNTLSETLFESPESAPSREEAFREIEKTFIASGGDTIPLKTHLLRELVRARWENLGYKFADICLYGAGKHTRWLLSVIKDVKGGPKILAILDDAPKDAKKIAGVPVVHTERALSLKPGCIALSTDAFQRKMRKNLRDQGVKIETIDLYEGLPPGPYEKE